MRRARRTTMAAAGLAVIALGLTNGGIAGAAPHPAGLLAIDVRSLDGSGNNLRHRSWGAARTNYTRAAPAHYGDRTGAIAAGPNVRWLSNRVFNDGGTNLFSERSMSQWAWTWGQFIDHDLGLVDETPGESAPISFDQTDPLERYTDDFGSIGFARTPAAPGTGTGTGAVRQQVNTLNSFIDASNVYGVSADRLEWLRAGPVDGDLADNAATLMLDANGYLPRVTARGDAAAAPPVDLMGALMGTPDRAAVAGDVRANENIALTAVQTLFVREHNRIVGLLPSSLGEGTKFEIARRVVGAEVQKITYEEFLPSIGVKLPTYRGYDPSVDPSVTNEFATVAFRAHSMVHGEFPSPFQPGRYTAAQLDQFRSWGVSVVDAPGAHFLVVPLTVAFGNPDMLEAVGLGPVLGGLAITSQYRNDEQIDDSMRSVLFEVPKPGTSDPTACQTPVVDPRCFSGVVDLGALDVMRGRDHGIETYNEMRTAYGLAPKLTFTGITGETTAAFPNDPSIDQADPIDDPDILTFTELTDAAGNVLDPADPNTMLTAVNGTRASTLAARLKGVYGTTGKVDAFVGMVAEPHVPGTELGELQLAVWTKQFAAIRDGDRFFYRGDPVLAMIRAVYGIPLLDLGQIVVADTDAVPSAHPFFVAAT